MVSSEAIDLAFTKALPKIELHAHLTGSISRQCLREIWLQKKAKNAELDIMDPYIAMPQGKVDFTLDTFFQVFTGMIHQLCTDSESLRYSTRSVLQDFERDGIRYLELRTTPRESLDQGISKEKYISTVLDTIDEYRSEQMSTYLIISVDRTKTASDALEAIDLAIKYQGRGVVGVELGGNPTRGDVRIFRPAFDKAKAHGLKLTLHFAESVFSSSPDELNTLLSYEPDRLGHVIHVPDDIKDEITRRKIGLELCLSCNVHGKLIQGGFPDHHFGYWIHQECPVLLSTDDVGFFCSPLSNEYLIAAESFHLDRGMVIDMCKKGIGAIFAGPEEKKRLYNLLSQFEAQNM
ncbi:adenosine deaminase [Histoplasma capsulatum G186AR]|uniref:Adenosine deaminase n=1 Tax=Ajellomyces capsulatus TaxID=5037 RepID=A0A8H7YKU5_AJECA|nr:adenosine deaminase [Histoplasma capsulatum]QSS74768.1 adenosine deaminase [Histoplasma capsulatum G186AR]